MSIRVVVLALVLVSSLFALPRAAEAGKAKSPFWAVVNADGTLARSNGATDSFRYQDGDYYVIFLGYDLTNCAFSATSSSGYATTLGVSAEIPNGARIRVFIVDHNAARVNVPFYLIATCAK